MTGRSDGFGNDQSFGSYADHEELEDQVLSLFRTQGLTARECIEVLRGILSTLEEATEDEA
jgi:hypothetical protein